MSAYCFMRARHGEEPLHLSAEPYKKTIYSRIRRVRVNGAPEGCE